MIKPTAVSQAAGLRLRQRLLAKAVNMDEANKLPTVKSDTVKNVLPGGMLAKTIKQVQSFKKLEVSS